MSVVHVIVVTVMSTVDGKGGGGNDAYLCSYADDNGSGVCKVLNVDGG